MSATSSIWPPCLRDEKSATLPEFLVHPDSPDAGLLCRRYLELRSSLFSPLLRLVFTVYLASCGRDRSTIQGDGRTGKIQ